MPHYIKRGEIPRKRHTQFRKSNGGLYAEQLVSTEGFSDVYSLIYHTYPPTVVTQIDEPINVAPRISNNKNMQNRCYKGFNIKPENDFLKSRKPVLVNNDCHVILAAPTKGTEGYFYKNSGADEMLFIHEGKGVLKTVYGELPFSYGDYLIVPRGTIYQISFETENNRLLIVEAFSPFRYPKRYCNHAGQLLEHSPFCERDIREPQNLTTHDEKGDFLVYIK